MQPKTTMNAKHIHGAHGEKGEVGAGRGLLPACSYFVIFGVDFLI